MFTAAGTGNLRRLGSPKVWFRVRGSSVTVGTWDGRSSDVLKRLGFRGLGLGLGLGFGFRV